MKREEAQIIVDNLAKVRHFAAGGVLEFEFRNFKDEFVRWEPVGDTLLVGCLPKMRLTKEFVAKKRTDGRKCRHCCRFYGCQERKKP